MSWNRFSHLSNICFDNVLSFSIAVLSCLTSRHVKSSERRHSLFPLLWQQRTWLSRAFLTNSANAPTFSTISNPILFNFYFHTFDQTSSNSTSPTSSHRRLVRCSTTHATHQHIRKLATMATRKELQQFNSVQLPVTYAARSLIH